MGKILENNNVTICGTLIGEFQFDHEVCFEKFYKSCIVCKRLSGAEDIIPITVSDRLLNVNMLWTGMKVRIFGSFRSYNKHTEDGIHLILTVFVDEIVCVENDEPDENEIHLSGYICKETSYKETPLGKEITDMLIAVNRNYGKSDYIPCICWGRNARFASDLNAGDRISIDGRIQSREYPKRLEDGEVETRTAYEVSVSSMEKI